MFDGIMDAPFYVSILGSAVLPFLRSVYPDGHRFMQDNDPKHTSRMANSFMLDNNVNWWKTPPESCDCNPFENLWHELKEFMRREIKPKCKQELGLMASLRFGELWIKKSVLGVVHDAAMLGLVTRVLYNCSILAVHIW